jgi:hypothetical protein
MPRLASGASGQARDLVRVRQRLDEWRRGHAPRQGSPEKLWIAAGRLAKRHGIYVTARALGLVYKYRSQRRRALTVGTALRVGDFFEIDDASN